MMPRSARILNRHSIPRTAALILTIWAASFAPSMAAAAGDPQADARIPELRTDTPSGHPVPRFVSLKSATTFCRQGPSFAHPVKITYQRRGLPVMIVAETRDDNWRKVRDSDGDLCWIHRTKLSGVMTALVVRDGWSLRTKPRDDAAQKARLGRGLVAKVETTRGDWLKISADGAKGWARREGFWGGSQLFRESE